MDDESRRKIKEDLISFRPSLKHNPNLNQMVEAILQGSQSQSDGQAENSEPNQNAQQQAGFFRDMEGFRKKEMADKSALAPTTDPEDERYFGEEQASPGQAWLRQMQRSDVETQGERQMPESDEPGLEAGQRRPAGVQSLETKAGAPQKSWLRNIPAAGRFGRTR